MAKVFLNWFWMLHKFFVWKNVKHKNINSGKTCLIFGNGGSLRYYDFSALPDLPAFCTTHSLADKRMKDVDVRYWILSDPYLLYPLRYMDFHKKIFKNKLLPIFKRYALNNFNVTLITSLTNLYSFFWHSNKIIYFHHFGKKSNLSYDLSENFTSCGGSLDIMIGAARYFGFSKAILLGCDYLGSPKLEGHFYGNNAPFVGMDDPSYCSRIKEIAGDLEIVVVLPEGHKSTFFSYVNFGKYFGVAEKYQSRESLIDQECLAMMTEASQYKQIHL
ncbi:hypothetical protein [Candidatus Methylopumilus planktonicus]|uniref:hypothetical protein n=1 Tax=Candidatus Methylopumilus planktonicus TaxID=1581557 RepID=UPI003D18DBFB